jgi:hypothetical protein
MASSEDVLLIGALIFVFGIGFFMVFFAMTQVTSQMVLIPEIASSQATVDVLNAQSNVINKMDYVIFGLFIGLVLGLIISGWFVGGHPIFMAIYFIVIVISVASSTVLSNVWETTTQASIFGATVANFPITNNLLTNLPIYLSAIGFLGMVVMFGKPFMMGNEQGGGTY